MDYKGPPGPVVQQRLVHYAALVRHWAPHLDLVSPGDLDRIEARHVADSLRALPLVAEAPAGPCVDVGSGAGFPGIPLAIASDRPWRLIEPRRKRAGFLEEVVRDLGLDCEVIVLTAEAAAEDPGLAEAHAFGICRALAAPEHALRMMAPLIRPGGVYGTFIGEGAVAPRESRVDIAGIATMTKSGG